MNPDLLDAYLKVLKDNGVQSAHIKTSEYTLTITGIILPTSSMPDEETHLDRDEVALEKLKYG